METASSCIVQGVKNVQNEPSDLTRRCILKVWRSKVDTSHGLFVSVTYQVDGAYKTDTIQVNQNTTIQSILEKYKSAVHLSFHVSYNDKNVIHQTAKSVADTVCNDYKEKSFFSVGYSMGYRAAVTEERERMQHWVDHILMNDIKHNIKRAINGE